MQQGVESVNGEQPQEPDWALASYGWRVGAWALDFVGSILIKILLIIGFLALASQAILDGFGVEKSIFEVIDWYIFPIAVVAMVPGIGYIVWWLFALKRGQTPGKQIVGIRVIKDDGTPSDWGYTFTREFVVKFFFLGLLSHFTFGVAYLVDCLWPLWDRARKMQTLHDKLLGTIVVRNR